MKYVILTDSLTKLYRKKPAVDHLDLKVPEGSIYGFLGPNGAGKSTTMKMLLGLVHPSDGFIQILGKEVNEKNRLAILKDTGSLIESPAYYGHLSGRENLQIICTLKQAPEQEIDRVLRIVRMENQQNKKVRQYSLGMKQRLGLAASLIGNPKILLLDEPTNGLDPSGIQEMRELICTLPKEYGITVLISSHLLSEIDQMATHVGIIDRGQLIFQDSLSALHEHSRLGLLLKTDNDTVAFELLQHSGFSVMRKNGRIFLKTSDDDATIRAIRTLVLANVGILRLFEQQMSLEEIFLHLTGRQVSL
ncbi:MAG: ATP-binding cassette domain-containing protein [Eubacteriales bacterium]|nr:ATP-binding cassette domain-containing protein [Eubacteriales bacterium]